MIQTQLKSYDAVKNEYAAVVCMIPLEDGLRPQHVIEIMEHFTDGTELVPIYVSENNTSVIGFAKSEIEAEEEIEHALQDIAKDWDLQPEDNIVVTEESEYRILILDI